MEYILGNEQIISQMNKASGSTPFSDEVIEFCQLVSKELMKIPEGRLYPDIVTLGFWLRKASILELKKRFYNNNIVTLGRGVIFHVAPSNVPVNFAYSLFSGLLCGNLNIVRIPSKDFPQVSIIVNAIKKAIDVSPEYSNKICLVKYGHEQKENDYLSSICNVRVIWGGDETISEIRKSSLPSRSNEVTFADRYSISVIDALKYSREDDKSKNIIARNFYNDTYLSDQNACTSPKVIYWLESEEDDYDTIKAIREEFWKRLWVIVEKEYLYQDIQGVNKLSKQLLLAAESQGSIRKVESNTDNRLVRIESSEPAIDSRRFDNSGYFIECIISDVSELHDICNDTHCQTVSYIGNKDMFLPLIKAGVKGIDRIVPVGKTMDFDLIWDGMNLFERLTRIIGLK